MEGTADKNPYSLRGQTALVTGSSTGIGRAIALELARGGADVLVHARESQQEAERLANDISQYGRTTRVILNDLAEPANRQRLVDQAWQWRDIDIWINNAGVDVLTGEAAGWTFDQKLGALWQVDVAATIALGRAAGERMKRRGSGVIINIGWDQAATGMAGDSGEMFAAIKGAVMAFTRSLAKSLAPHVRVNCLAPGWIRTKWAAGASESWQRRAQEECLLGRWGEPDDVARVARFLVSPAGSFINGQIVPVNGGFC